MRQLLARMAQYGASADQVPPTLFWPFNDTAHGIAPWNYQCPQCTHGGALPGPQGPHFDPWCDHVACGSGPPAPPGPAPAPPAPAPAPSPSCPWHMQAGGLGGKANPDTRVVKASGWEACCVVCIQHTGCAGWTFYTGGSDAGACHLHANDKDQHPQVQDRITGLAPDAPSPQQQQLYQ